MKKNQPPIRAIYIAAIYLVLSSLWILFSDRLVANWAIEPDNLTRLQTYKGWGFVVISALMIYLLVRFEEKRFWHTKIELENNQDSFQNLFSNNPQPMWVYDLKTYKFLSVNVAAIQKYGYSEAEFLASTIKDIRPAEEIHRLEEDLAKARPDYQDSGIWWHQTKQGLVFPVRINSHTLTFNNRPAVLVTAVDLSQQFEIEQQRIKAEQARVELEQTIRYSPAVVFVWELAPGCPVSYVTENIQQFGYAPDYFIQSGVKFSDIIAEEDRERVSQAAHTYANQQVDQFMLEFRIKTQDGQLRWVNVYFIASYDSDGQTTDFRGILLDVTERKEIEFARQNAETILHDLINTLPDPALAINLQGEVIYWNQLMEVLTEIPADQILGKNGYIYGEIFYGEPRPLLVNLIVEDQQDQIRQYYPAAEIKNQTISTEAELPNFRGGMTVWVNVRPLFDARGNKIGAIETVRDITSRKRIEIELQKKTDHLDGIIQASPLAIFTLDTHGIVQTWNSAAERIFGWTAEEAIGQWIPFVDQSTKSEAQAIFNRVMQGNNMTGIETIRHRKDGQPIDINIYAAPLHNAQGEITGLVGVLEDISKRKHYELEREELLAKVQHDIEVLEVLQHSLAQQEKKLRSIIERSSDGIILTNEEGIVIEWNDAETSLTGISREQAIGKSLFELQKMIFYPDNHPLESAEMNDPLHAYQPALPIAGNLVEGVIKRTDGTQSFIESTLFNIDTPKGSMIGSIDRDITGRKLAEQKIIQARNFYLTLFENLPALIYRCGIDARLDYFNQTWLAFTGRRMDDILGDGWLIDVHPNFQSPRQEMFFNAFQQRQKFEMEYQLRRHDGTYRWVLDIGRPYYDMDGDFAGYIGMVYDITERYMREREMETMLALSSSLRSATSRTEILDTLLKEMDRLVSTRSAAFGMWDENTDRLIVETACGKWQSVIGMDFSQGFSVSRDLIEQNRSISNFDFRTSPIYSRYAFIEPDHFGTGVPLIAQDTKLGILWAGGPVPLTEVETHLIKVIADIASMAIHRTTLYDKTRLYIQQLSTVSAVGQAMAESLQLTDIYRYLTKAVFDLFIDINEILLGNYNRSNETIQYSLGVKDGVLVNTKNYPPIKLASDQAISSEISLVIQSQRPAIIEHHNYFPQEILACDPNSPVQSVCIAPLVAEGRVLGILQVHSQLPNRFDENDLSLLGLVANTAAVAMENASLLDNLQYANLDLRKAYDTTLEGWARALELRDQETEGHSKRVVEMTLELADAAGVPHEELEHVHRGALLHDIGKMGIPDSILSKPGPLTEEEWAIMRKHPIYAYNLLSPIEYLAPALDIPYCHHERWNGSGYPRGLKGKEIPLSARIFAIVDVWDALRSDRPYRKAWSRERTIAYMLEESGKQFDPEMIQLFLDRIDLYDPMEED